MKLDIPYPDALTKEEIEGLKEQKRRQINRLICQELRKKKEKKMTRVRNPIDMYGKKIEEGHYINYPVRKGSSTYMRTAKVLAVQGRKNHLEKDEVVLKVAVAIPPRVWDRKGNRNWENEVRVKKVTVSRPHRATILPEEYIKSDKRYRTLLTI
jgi:hypothetical protein